MIKEKSMWVHIRCHFDLFQDGTKREVKEEAGLECDLMTLLSVEVSSYKWIRFTFLGKITGWMILLLSKCFI